MSETILSYRKAVKLRAGSFDESRPLRAALDEQVFKAVASLAEHEPELQSARASEEGGNFSMKATTSGYDIVVTTRSGQDAVFQGGERRTFISYTISASSSLRTLDRAASVSRELGFALRGIGAIAFGILFFWSAGALLHKLGIIVVRVPVALIVAVVLAGAWVGERLGHLVSNKLESRAWSRAEQSGAAPQLELIWTHLEERLNALLRPHEAI